MPVPGTRKFKQARKQKSRLNTLTLLNLLGLIELGKLAALMKINGASALDQALTTILEASAFMHKVTIKFKIHASKVATFQMLEELRDNF